MEFIGKMKYIVLLVLLLVWAGCGDERSETLPTDDMISIFPQVYDLSDSQRPQAIHIEFSPFDYLGNPYEDGTGGFWLNSEALGYLADGDDYGTSLSFTFTDGTAECSYFPTNADEVVTVYAGAGGYPYDIIASARIYIVNQVLSAEFQYAATGLTVNFDNLSQPSSLGGALTYAWDFGDGSTSAVENPSHTYAADGSYFVVLTVTEGTLTDTIQYTVTVVAP
jgi:PKD repeat protein